MPDLRHLEYLVAIAEEGTFSAAAETLHITQPALTRMMQRLEEELRLELFERTKNRAELNDAGKLAVECAKTVLESARQMTDRMDRYRRSLTTLAVGFCAPGPTFPLIPRLTALYPEMTISSVLHPADTLREELRNGTFQMIALSHPWQEEDILCRSYVKENLMVSLPRTHPLADRKELQISDLAGLTMLLSSGLGIWQELHDKKMENVQFIVQNDRKALNELIFASEIPNFVTNLSVQYHISAVPENRIAIPLTDPEATVQFWLCVRKKYKNMLDNVTEGYSNGIIRNDSTSGILPGARNNRNWR